MVRWAQFSLKIMMLLEQFGQKISCCSVGVSVGVLLGEKADFVE